MSIRDEASIGHYGVLESNPITDEVVAFRERLEGTVELDDPQLAKIVRLRLLSDPGFPMVDLSYCYGELRDGTAVRVQLPRHQFPKRGLEKALVAMCREAGVYGKGLGLFDAISYLE